MKSKKINIIIIFLSMFFLLGYAFLVDSPKSLFNALKAAQGELLFIACLCMLIYWILESVALFFVSYYAGYSLKFKDCFQISMVGQLFNSITPFASGGQPVQAYMMVKKAIPLSGATSVLLAKFIVYQTVLTLYSLVLIIWKFSFFINNVSGFGYLVFIGFIVNFIVVVMLFSIGFFPVILKNMGIKCIVFLKKIKLIKNDRKLIETVTSEINRFSDDFKALRKNILKMIIVPSIVTVAQLTVFFTVPYFICLSLDITSINWIIAVSACAFVLMISSFVPLPGGSGGAEGGFYLFFSMFFVKSATLAIAIVLWRMLTFYLPIISGAFFMRANKKVVQNS